MPEAFAPTVYVRKGCPFSLKFRIFLLETGQLGDVTIAEGQDDAEHQRLADHLTDKLGKASFPSAEIAPGVYLADSDSLVAHFSRDGATNPKSWPVFQAYIGHVMPRLQQLFRENLDLKQKMAR